MPNFANIFFHLSQQVGIECVKFIQCSKESKARESSRQIFLFDYDLYNLLAGSSPSNTFEFPFYKVLFYKGCILYIRLAILVAIFSGAFVFRDIKVYLRYSISVAVSTFISMYI